MRQYAFPVHQHRFTNDKKMIDLRAFNTSEFSITFPHRVDNIFPGYKVNTGTFLSGFRCNPGRRRRWGKPENRNASAESIHRWRPRFPVYSPRPLSLNASSRTGEDKTYNRTHVPILRFVLPRKDSTNASLRKLLPPSRVNMHLSREPRGHTIFSRAVLNLIQELYSAILQSTVLQPFRYVYNTHFKS